MNLPHLLVFATVLLLPLPSAVYARDYDFDRTITRTALENYLSRSITMLESTDRTWERGRQHPNAEERRSEVRWEDNLSLGHESQLPTRLVAARQNAPKVHAADPQMILQTCVFEIVSKDVDKLPVPGWAFEAFGHAGTAEFPLRGHALPRRSWAQSLGKGFVHPRHQPTGDQVVVLFSGRFLHRRGLRGNSLRSG